MLSGPSNPRWKKSEICGQARSRHRDLQVLVRGGCLPLTFLSEATFNLGEGTTDVVDRQHCQCQVNPDVDRRSMSLTWRF